MDWPYKQTNPIACTIVLAPRALSLHCNVRNSGGCLVRTLAAVVFGVSPCYSHRNVEGSGKNMREMEKIKRIRSV
jgi:hypothetical protein